MREGRHHGHAAQTDDVRHQGQRPLRQADFVYLPEENVYRCPAGERLKYYFTTVEGGLNLRRYWTNACRTCAA